jgi:hypothetical protein
MQQKRSPGYLEGRAGPQVYLGGAIKRPPAVRLCPPNERHKRDEAFLIAVNFAKLPSVPRQILKDIPRPPNSASRDD